MSGKLPAAWAELLRARRRFHEVEPQKDLALMAPPQVISQQLLRRNHTLIPYPALSEKTLVLSEHAVVGTADTPDNDLSLMVR